MLGPVMARRGRRIARGLACALLGLGLAGCALYHAAPLPPPEQLSSAPRLDEARLREEAAALHQPLVGPVALDLRDGVDPDEAGVLAVLLDPDLAAARDARGEAAARRITAELLPNPSLDAEIEHPYGSGSSGLLNVVNLAVSIDLHQLLLRWPRTTAARADAAQVDLGVAWQEWQVAQQARLLTLRLGWLERRLAIVRDELALEQRSQQRLQDALASGDASYEQLGVQRAAVETVRRNLVDLEQTAVQTRSALLALFGEPADFALEVAPPAPAQAIPAPPPAARLVPACLANRLDLAALRKGYEAQDARLRAALIEQLPNVSIGLTRQRNESSIRFFGGLVSLGLPVFDRNQGGVALEQATRQRLRDEYEARATGVRASVGELLRLLALFARRIPEVQDAIEPLADIERAERDAADRGDVDWLSYQTVRLALLDQRLQAASLAQARDEARVGLDAACGVRREPEAARARGAAATGGAP
jgi:outer membrane protein, heavy metal efflux system